MIEIIEKNEEVKNQVEFRKSYFKIDDSKKTIEGNVLQITEMLNDPNIGTASKIWDCGIILAKYMHFNWTEIRQSIVKSDANSLNILELGSGTGILGLYLAYLGNNVTLSDLPAVTNSILKKNCNDPINNLMLKFHKGFAKIQEIDWNLSADNYKEFLINAEIDLIVASDPIFNKKNLEIFTTFLKSFKQLYEKNNLKVPIVYVSHKARDDSLDETIPEMFENAGFFGDQIEESKINPEFINPRIDIFRFEV